MKRTAQKRFPDVWAALDLAPTEAQHLRVRSELMLALSRVIQEHGLTQAAAAERFGVSQPRVSDLMRGKIDRFSIDALVQMLGAAGLHVTVSVRGARPATSLRT